MDEQDELDSPEPDTPEEQEQMSVTTPARDIITPAPSRALAAPRKSGASAFVHNDATMLSAPYRNLIKQSAARLTEPKRGVFDKAKLNLKGGESYRHLGVDSYPGGPSTPFGTRLKARPPGRGRVKVEVVDEPDDTVERRNKRQKRIYQVGRFVPLLSPWEVWEGEGWWPEMWDGGGKGKGKGKGKAGWKMRDEVKIGLDHVGRMRFDELELLSEA
jgi:transcription factor C subunit 6